MSRRSEAQHFIGLSIIVPAYNEEKGIEGVIERLQEAVAKLECPAEIIVVDDGSTDQTYRVSSAFSDIVTICHEFNRGYGAALKTGIQRAQYGFICITDADGTYPIQQIPELVEYLFDEELDMVVGARTGDRVRIPLIRRPAKWFISQLANFASNSNIPDLNSGLRIFRKSAAIRFLAILPDGFSFTTTITLAMLMHDYRVAYIPINYFARKGKSKIRPIRDTMNFIQLVLRIALYFAPIKMFLSIAVPFLLAGLILFARFIYFYALGEGGGHIQSLVFGMTSVILAFQAILLGALADLIAINRRLSEDWTQQTMARVTTRENEEA